MKRLIDLVKKVGHGILILIFYIIFYALVSPFIEIPWKFAMPASTFFDWSTSIGLVNVIITAYIFFFIYKAIKKKLQQKKVQKIGKKTNESVLPDAIHIHITYRLTEHDLKQLYWDLQRYIWMKNKLLPWFSIALILALIYGIFFDFTPGSHRISSFIAPLIFFFIMIVSFIIGYRRFLLYFQENLSKEFVFEMDNKNITSKDIAEENKTTIKIDDIVRMEETKLFFLFNKKNLFHVHFIPKRILDLEQLEILRKLKLSIEIGRS